MIKHSFKILLVEDNDALRAATIDFLTEQGHDVRGVPSAEDVSEVSGVFVPDVYVIDLGLPDEDGLSLTQRIRTVHPDAGILITTARTQVVERVNSYRSGADIYLAKPVYPEELISAVESLGRRLLPGADQAQALVLSSTKRQITGPKGSVDLTFGDFSVLGALARSPGQSLERWQLGEIIGNEEDGVPSAATLEMRISRLRRKLQQAGAPPPAIKAVHKLGYALCCRVLLQR